MPIKRRVEKRRLDVLNLAQKTHLMCGRYLIPYLPPFEDAEHRREAWVRHRAELMARERPGIRPRALWDYERSWPEGSESEQDAVHRLPDTTEAERREIEANWQRSLRVALLHGKTEDDARARAAGFHGVPSWFFDRHAPRIRAKEPRCL